MSEFEDEVNRELADGDFDLDFLEEALVEEDVPQGMGDVVTLFAAATGSRYVTIPSGETISIADAMVRANLLTQGVVTYWIDEVQVEPTHQVGNNAHVDIRGVVKGG